MTGRRAAIIIIITPALRRLAHDPAPPTHGVVGPDRLRGQKVEAHVVGTPVQQLDGRRQDAPQQQVALTYLKGRVHVHEPAADVPHEREAPAMQRVAPGAA